MVAVTLSRLVKSYGDTPILKGIDFEARDGEFVVFVGPSGCGKSTILRAIAGLEPPDSGDILFDGRRVNDVSSADRRIGMVFQSYALYPHMTVAENMTMSMRLAGAARADRRRRAEEVARLLQITPLLDRKPAALSGGQRQRVAIGRALVREPSVFLFDEPLSNLDAALRGSMRVSIAELHQQIATTMIYVTHDQTEAMTMADRIVILDAGRIVQVGAPMELYSRPVNRFVAGFLGSPTMNFIELQGADGQGLSTRAGARIASPQSGMGMAPASVGVRPEHLTVATDGEIAGQVTIAEQLGGETLVHVRTDDGLLVSKMPGGFAVRPGETVRLRVDGTMAHVFDATGNAVHSN